MGVGVQVLIGSKVCDTILIHLFLSKRALHDDQLLLELSYPAGMRTQIHDTLTFCLIKTHTVTPITTNVVLDYCHDVLIFGPCSDIVSITRSVKPRPAGPAYLSTTAPQPQSRRDRISVLLATSHNGNRPTTSTAQPTRINGNATTSSAPAHRSRAGTEIHGRAGWNPGREQQRRGDAEGRRWLQTEILHRMCQ